MSEIAAVGVTVRRGDRGSAGATTTALDGVDVRIAPGECVAVMGGTGSGKSTLALVLAGLLEPTSGRIEGAAVGQVRLVLQRPESTFLAEHVLDEVCLALRARDEPEAAAARHAAALLELLALPPDTRDRDPLALSGGEQRRVAIAATLAADARVLVLDEPGAGLDHAARAHLHAVVRDLNARGRTIVLVSHDPEEVARLATRLVVLRAGRVVADDVPARVLGDPARARALGIAAVPEVELLYRVAAARGAVVQGHPATGAEATRALAELLRAVAHPRAAFPDDSTTTPAVADPPSHRAPLPALVDARIRLLATGAAMVAALLATSLLVAALVTAAAAAVVALARVERSRVRLTVRPLAALTVLLVVLQLLVGGAPEVDLYPGQPATFAAAPALLRALQAGAIVLATLALAASTTALDLTTALRRLLAPLSIVRVPVASLAFVVATALGLVPAMADELDRLRLARRARGLDAGRRGPIARIRADSALVAPLFVAAFRRAHLLADALAVRGIDPRRPGRPWRAQRTPATDTLLLVAGVALVVVARFT